MAGLKKLEFLTFSWTLPSGYAEPHQSSLMGSDRGLKGIGVIQHMQVLKPTKENVQALRDAAEYLEHLRKDNE